MILENLENHKTLVIVLGHQYLDFLIDNEEAFRFFHPNTDDYIFTFVVDNDESISNSLCEIYGKEFVYFTGTKNGWGRGCLRSFIAGIDYFEKHHKFNDVLTFDADCICTGPFLSEFSKKCRIDKKTFFGGTMWPLSDRDVQMHNYFHNQIGLPFSENFSNSKPEVVAGPCMLWTESCLEYMRSHGWFPLKRFDSFYDHLYFPHDQISAYFQKTSNCKIVKINRGMFLCVANDRNLFYKSNEEFGEVPVIKDARVLHPTGTGDNAANPERNYELEKKNRAYLKQVRASYSKNEITREEFVKQDAEPVVSRKPAVVVHSNIVFSKNCGKGCKGEKSCKNKAFI